MATKNLQIGSALPSFNLPGTADKFYSSEDFREKKVLVIIFSCNHCPYVQAYEDRIKKIQSDYSGQGVTVIAINSNDDKNYPDDSLDNMIKRSKERAFNFLYLRDESQDVAKAFDATHTPEIFLFNEKKKLVYHGKIDDNWKEPEKVNNKYLRNAIDEMLAGKNVSVPETFSIGCTIKWKNN
jgi:peroxiredoxin